MGDSAYAQSTVQSIFADTDSIGLVTFLVALISFFLCGKAFAQQKPIISRRRGVC
jgi:hypothetical protein